MCCRSRRSCLPACCSTVGIWAVGERYRMGRWGTCGWGWGCVAWGTGTHRLKWWQEGEQLQGQQMGQIGQMGQIIQMLMEVELIEMGNGWKLNKLSQVILLNRNVMSYCWVNNNIWVNRIQTTKIMTQKNVRDSIFEWIPVLNLTNLKTNYQNFPKILTLNLHPVMNNSNIKI